MFAAAASSRNLSADRPRLYVSQCIIVDVST